MAAAGAAHLEALQSATPAEPGGLRGALPGGSGPGAEALSDLPSPLPPHHDHPLRARPGDGLPLPPAQP